MRDTIDGINEKGWERAMAKIETDSDILTAKAIHLYGELTWERVKQDRRIYYAMCRNGSHTGSLTTAKHARETIAYWRKKGWMNHGA